jgi:hypothetical protein
MAVDLAFAVIATTRYFTPSDSNQVIRSGRAQPEGWVNIQWAKEAIFWNQ